jgi:ribosomal protein S5
MKPQIEKKRKKNLKKYRKSLQHAKAKRGCPMHDVSTSLASTEEHRVLLDPARNITGVIIAASTRKIFSKCDEHEQHPAVEQGR